MRSFEYEEPKDIERLNAQPWMLELIKLNPSYCSWGPYEDSMIAKDGNWRAPVFCETWSEFGPWKLDEMNELANFYFEVQRAAEGCEACDGEGSNPETREISRAFYAHDGGGGRWCDRITKDEALALRSEGRDHDFKTVPDDDLADAFNRAERARGIGHDAINRWILIEARATRLGVWGYCPACEGEGHIYTEPAAHVGLVLWMLHPRKGASRGVEVKRIEQAELPAVFSFLREGAARNAERFSRIPTQPLPSGAQP